MTVRYDDLPDFTINSETDACHVVTCDKESWGMSEAWVRGTDCAAMLVMFPVCRYHEELIGVSYELSEKAKRMQEGESDAR